MFFQGTRMIATIKKLQIRYREKLFDVMTQRRVISRQLGIERCQLIEDKMRKQKELKDQTLKDVCSDCGHRYRIEQQYDVPVYTKKSIKVCSGALKQKYVDKEIKVCWCDYPMSDAGLKHGLRRLAGLHEGSNPSNVSEMNRWRKFKVDVYDCGVVE